MKKTILALTVASLVGSFGVANAYNGYHHNDYHMQNMPVQHSTYNCCNMGVNQDIIYSMHAPMMNVSLVESGNVDKDFIANMIPHHQGAIDSARLVLQYSNNDDVRTIAENIIKAQEQEIKDFNILLDNKLVNTNITKESYKKFVADEKVIMNDMMEKMMSVQNTRDLKSVDYTFILAMKYHHEGAVKMSEQILQYTNDDTVKKIAQNIINDQNKEIKHFDKLIKQGL